jgi:hypothetical protein
MEVDDVVVAIIVTPVGIEVVIDVAVRIVALGLVVKALADLVDENEIMPVFDGQSLGFDQRKIGVSSSQVM